MSIVRSICQPIVRPLTRAIGEAGGVGAVAWEPSALFGSGEKGVAYDLSTSSGLFQDSARTTPVTAVSDPIGSVTDISGNGVNASQTTAGSRPLWQGDSALFDGSDDRWVTGAIDFTGTDAVTVVACIRKGSDAAVGCVVELGTGGEAGSFLLNAPNTAAAAGFSFTSRGTTTGVSSISAGYAAGTDYVVTGVGRISTDTSILRVNSTQVATAATDQGTGNYRNGALYIGRRGVNTNPFNGRIYRIIVIGRHLTAGELAEAEAWVAAPLA